MPVEGGVFYFCKTQPLACSIITLFWVFIVVSLALTVVGVIRRSSVMLFIAGGLSILSLMTTAAIIFLFPIPLAQLVVGTYLLLAGQKKGNDY